MPINTAMITIATLCCFAAARAQADVRVERQGNGTARLVLTGFIGDYDHCHAARALADNPSIRRVEVNSPGGSAWAGAQLGRLFSWAGLEAVVPKGGQALSAAGIAALGAPTRRVEGRLGLHQPYQMINGVMAVGTVAVIEAITEIRAVLTESGVPDSLITTTLSTDPSLMVILDRATAEGISSSRRPDRERVLRIAEACQALKSLVGAETFRRSVPVAAKKDR